ncbi:type II toxin-antitoxin system HicB family antitoxin [Bilifractor porci]|uniref:Type II toxin-antitoxin system HicB family antitoxin n=1 Tax=Bilifractor porci TaxID=2606636 RepID=A0A7X2TNM4_9FIRM|nr:type II toxin-antitoxin system HicB family antitoxin [Bilifractor porci]MST81113.1 type II toxin-antitoxin system HicB family antitoxin [Bilifractor porci]
MAKYAYPAVFTPEKDGGYSVYFPDIAGCYTQGDNMADAIFMAEDALELMLYEYEEGNKEMPKPSDLQKIKSNEGEIVSYVSADTLKYRKMFNNKAVKKTLSIPEWMNEAAMRENINFSQVLQDALVQRLNLG